VSVINQNCAEALKHCGPAILGVNDLEKQMTIIIAALLTRCHPCQQDFGDEADVNMEGGSSEYDWLVIDTTLDVIIGLAAALGENFAPHWVLFSKPVIKLASSQEDTERSTSTGTIAEVIKYMGSAVTPFTEQLSKIVMKRLSDLDDLTKSNAAFAIGQLIYLSQDRQVLRLFEDVVVALEPALETNGSTMKDNVAGCFARMMMKNPDPVVVDKLLPLVVRVLPLTEDFEENQPIFQCLFKLCKLPPGP
jgi:importin-4